VTITEDTEGQLHSVLVEAAAELLEGLGMSAEPGHADEDDLAAVIGFTSEHLCGNLLLRAQESFVERTRSQLMGGRASTHAERCDWVAELSNQLLGRIKNKLISRGVSIAMTTPSVIEGRSISISRPPSTEKHLRFHLKTGTGPLWAWLDLEAQPTLALLACDTADDVVSEGDVLMF
jgi:CheY-specific phosphatase CheX